jgi:hypothetical protein
MFSISGKIIFEDSQENLHNEDTKEVMDWEEDVHPYNLENLTNLTQYMEHQPTELDSKDPTLDNLMEDIQTKLSSKNTILKYKTNSVDQKTLSLYYIKMKLF